MSVQKTKYSLLLKMPQWQKVILLQHRLNIPCFFWPWKFAHNPSSIDMNTMRTFTCIFLVYSSTSWMRKELMTMYSDEWSSCKGRCRSEIIQFFLNDTFIPYSIRSIECAIPRTNSPVWYLFISNGREHSIDPIAIIGSFLNLPSYRHPCWHRH